MWTSWPGSSRAPSLEAGSGSGSPAPYPVRLTRTARCRDGARARIRSSHHAKELRARTGVVLQECGFPLHLRVVELIEVWRSFYPRPRPVEELVAIVELTTERDAVVRRLSGGQRRRLDFGLALAGDPELIFIDEPTTGFDPEARRRCWEVIENPGELGTTVLPTTRYLDEAEHLADRVAILQDGRIRACGTPAELARQVGAEPRMERVQPSLEETYLDVVGTAEGTS